MTPVTVDDYLEVRECTYNGERYLVRDNGAVFRHSREGNRMRASDAKWTFGRENPSTPYLHLAGVQVHRIVATAFHGEPEGARYVVDHIDTNCRNNRPENLRWLTRLENVLKNPVTRRKVEFLCGSIEAFLDNPSLLRDASGSPNFGWMRAVTPEEAKNCKARMQLWASAPPTPRATGRVRVRFPRDLSRLHRPLSKGEAGLPREPGLDFAMTPRSAQYMWSHSIHFPCCPLNIGPAPLDDYLRNTGVDVVLAYSDEPGICPELTIQRVEYLRDRAALLVLCSRAGAGWAIVGVEVTGDRIPHFVHFDLGSYPSESDATVAFAEKSAVDFWADGYARAQREWQSRTQLTPSQRRRTKR